MFKMSPYLKRIIEYTKKQNDDNNYFALWYKENGGYYIHAVYNDKKVIPIFQDINIAQKILYKSDLKDNYVLVPISYNNPFGTTTDSLFVITEEDDVYIDKNYCLHKGPKINITTSNTIGDLILITNSSNNINMSVTISKKEKMIKIVNISHPDKPIVLFTDVWKFDDIVILPSYIKEISMNDIIHPFIDLIRYDLPLSICVVSLIYVSGSNELILYFPNGNNYIEIHNVTMFIEN